MNLDLSNSRTLTILVIVVLISFAIVYVWMNRDGFDDKEGFINYPVGVSDFVQLQGGLNNVQVGSNNTPLPTLINNMIQQELNNVVPPLTIVSFYGTTAPLGWQICNGLNLQAMDSKTVYDNSGNIIKTPNLQGRVIVGSNISSGVTPNINTGLSIYNVGDYGGAENHTLTVQEIPAHSHSSGAMTHYYHIENGATGGLRIDDFYRKGNFTGGQTGGGAPHYNMQPYYVLIYIIKKPLTGGSDNPVSTILPTNAPIVDRPKI
jgi:microcystin-dependent protein